MENSLKTLFIIVFGILINISAYANLKVNGTLNDECDFLKNKIERLLYNADFDQKEEDKNFIKSLKEQNFIFYTQTWGTLCK